MKSAELVQRLGICSENLTYGWMYLGVQVDHLDCSPRSRPGLVGLELVNWLLTRRLMEEFEKFEREKCQWLRENDVGAVQTQYQTFWMAVSSTGASQRGLMLVSY